MKEQPRYDFPVNVEEDLEDASNPDDLNRDIFLVTLNSVVNIMFVPEFGWQAEAWPPPMPTSEEEAPPIETVQQARRVAATSRYVVTPHAQMADETIAFENSGFTTRDGYVVEPTPNVLFFVAPQVFAHYLEELHALVEQIPSRFQGTPVSELPPYDVLKFLQERVICSPFFLQGHRHMLGR